MKTIYILFTILLFSLSANAQKTLSGTVVNQDNAYLIGATVQWENTSIGAITDTVGQFEMPHSDTAANLVVNYVGFEPVLIPVAPDENDILIEISGISELDIVEVAARNRSSYTSTIETRNIESINSGELKKAPCCNLSESFETNASVDVAYSDAITGAKEIQMLGLRGVYTQLLMEKRPVYYGLAMPYALEYIPGTWLESIQISKGLNSLQTGAAGIAGQINTELQKPDEDVPVFVNLFGSTASRGEVNIHLNKKFNERYSSGLLLHGNIQDNRIDQDGNTFLDMPNKKVLNGLYRFRYRGEDFNTQFNIQGITESRTAGQIVPENANADDYYQIIQNNNRLEAFGKLGYFGFEKSHQSVGSIVSATYHELDASYGNRHHHGIQRSFYTNLFFNTIIGTTDHKLTLGAGYQYDDYDEFLDDVDYSREEHIPGVFAEYNYQVENIDLADWWHAFAIIGGLRTDYHNQFGLLVSPQASAKLNFSEESVVRVSAGRGFRSPSILAENIGFLASSRNIVLSEPIEIEEAWNFGVNFTQNFIVASREVSLSTDFYRTNFVNQIVLDMEQDINNLYFYNLKGESFSNSFLASLDFELLRGLDMKVAYKFNEVKMTIDGTLRERLLVAKHRGLVTLDWESPDEKWRFNTNLQFVGPQRLPDNTAVPDNIETPTETRTPSYALVNAQLTWVPRNNFELYLGGENLTNFQQSLPVIGYENPFGDYFDATQVYGPTMGARGYVGLRLSIE